MNISQSISCPQCNGRDFHAKYEATYVYTYAINTATSLNTTEENLPFMFDKRDQGSSKQYIECKECGAQYPCSFKLNTNKIDFTILQKAIRADHKDAPEFLG